MTPEELDFCDWSMLVDDPKRLEAYENSFYDPEFEEYTRRVEEDIRRKEEERALMQKAEAEELARQGYSVPTGTSAEDEWERVD